MTRRDRRICTNCGAVNLGFHELCPICNSPLPPLQADRGAVTMVSQPAPPSHSTAPPPQPVAQRPVPQAAATPGRSSGRRAVVIIAAVIVLLCLCSCVCVFAARSGTFGSEIYDIINDIESFIRGLLS